IIHHTKCNQMKKSLFNTCFISFNLLTLCIKQTLNYMQHSLTGRNFNELLPISADGTTVCVCSAESRRPVKDCFLAVLSSHGEEDCVFGADGKPVRLSRIFAYFDNECMENKAKVFLIQACRGDALDDGVEVDSAGDATDCSFSLHLSVPADTAVMYATPPGYGAFMSPLGSVFLQTFCTLLEDEAHQNLELTRLMTRLSHRVAYTFQAKGRELGGKKEMPCFLTRLTREVVHTCYH
uniref:Caspase 3, apoptosis-related cysteine peptidase b n=1 Tax=Pundamilia nyererei TaxID=303518 RepID=A0A3B4G3B8_9CICH